MIHPLTRYSIRGAFWFQGEHNVVTHSSREEYACAFGAMINEWRDAWTGIGDFPFMWAQLAPYTGYAPFAGKGDISTVRLAQADDLPHIGLDTTGMAVTIDLGDPKAPAGDVHSRVKDPVAYRLALQAMHAAYAFQEGENVTNWDHPKLTPHPFPLHFSGPLVTEAAMHAQANDNADADADAGKLTIKFAHGEGLYLNDTRGCDIHRGINFAGQPIGGECCKAKDTFQVCTGDDKNTSTLSCVNATGHTLGEGEVTVTWSPSKLQQAAAGASDGAAGAATSVRYAYANYPQCAMFNKYDLPAGPFVAKIATSSETALAAAAPPSSEGVGVCKTPPMGVNTWNSFHCNVDERKMRAMADAIVSSGLSKAGYECVSLRHS